MDTRMDTKALRPQKAARGAGEEGRMSAYTFPEKPVYTPGPWQIVQSFNGFRIVRYWSGGGLTQVKRTGWLKTREKAEAALAQAAGGAA